MAAARLMKLQELPAAPPASAPWSAHVFHASTPPMPSTAYPPIYLSPSSNAFTPAPAPLVSAVVSASHRSAISKAGIVGGTVAGTVLTLAVAATVISTVTGKIGIWSCLLTPALNALSSLASKLKLCSNFPHWNSKNDHYYEGSDAPEDRPEIYLYEALGDPIAGSAAAAAGMQLQNRRNTGLLLLGALKQSRRRKAFKKWAASISTKLRPRGMVVIMARANRMR